VVAGLVLAVPNRPVLAVGGSLLALGAGVQLFRSTSARVVLGGAAASAAGIVLVAHAAPANVGWFGVCILAGWCALVAGPPAAVGCLAATLVLFAAEWFVVHDAGWAPWAGGTTFTVLAALVLRRQMVLVEQLRALQADLAARSRAEERTRIARELHDVIAHSLTVSLLHVSSARLAVEHDPDDAARALADAERLTRQSLADVRATVGMLRQSGDDGVAAPSPGIDDLPRLVADLRAAQADVSLDLDGDLDAVPATTGTTVYRIVQEALTNASRHAPGAPVRVHVAARDDRVDVSVDSAGAPGDGVGMGLANMKERAEAVGGTCAAGPGGRGWLVRASLPRVALSNGSGR
jgi:signal transduction histidine kinase